MKQVTMMEVLGHNEEYYMEDYQNVWRGNLELLEKITNNCTKEEVQKLYYMINYEISEFMKMIKYIENNKN